jgi:hypothetical protein
MVAVAYYFVGRYFLAKSFYTSYKCTNLFSKRGKNVQIYYAEKNSDNTSVYRTSVDINDLNEQMGMMPLITPYLMKEKQKLIEKEQELQNA